MKKKVVVTGASGHVGYNVARELLERGVEVSELKVFGENHGPGGELDNVGFVFFSDPDGNSWGVQQISYDR